MTQPTVGACGNCLFWAPLPANPPDGQCHRYPPVVYQPSAMGRFIRVAQSDWCGDWVQLTSNISTTVNLSPSNGVAAGATVALAQAAGTLSTPFTLDGLGRLSVTSACTVTVTATFKLSRPVAQGATGQGLLRLPASADANLTDPVAVGVALADVGGVATCTLSWTATLAANTSFEIDYTNSSSGGQDCQGGTLQVQCRNWT